MTKLLALATLLALTAHASGTPKSDARRHVELATKAHAAGDFDTALLELQAAYALDPKPDLLYAIGQVQSKLGNCTEATAYFEKFRATQREASVARVIDQAIAACKPRDVAPPPPPPPPPAPLPVERPAPIAPPPPAARSPWYKDAVGDGLVGVGLAAGVVGFLFYESARSDLDSAEASSSLATYHDLVNESHSRRSTAVILMAGGGILAIAGVAKYLRHGHDHERATVVGIVPDSGGGIVTLGGRF